MWISNSDIAGVFLVFANANPSAVSRSLCIHQKEEIVIYINLRKSIDAIFY